MTASKFTEILTAAATKHSIPVDPVSLLDHSQAFHQNCLRSQLNAIIAWHLHQNHKVPIARIAKAYNREWETIQSRIKRGKALSKKTPWKQTYLSLP